MARSSECAENEACPLSPWHIEKRPWVYVVVTETCPWGFANVDGAGG